ncbi:hypothetical protein [Promineifilum sp.]|uniref:hypothetical protein n=1 Tax=Promineifilum sp. TaxID=2664178 RepID=UPI0035B35C55
MTIAYVIHVLARMALLGIGLLLFGCTTAPPATPEVVTAEATDTDQPPTASPAPLVAATDAPTAAPTATPTGAATSTPTSTLAPTSDPSTWATYHDPNYGFSFRYPAERWTPARPADDGHLLSLTYHEMAIALRIKVKRLGEDADMQLYGGAAGDFVPQGTILFLGEEVERTALVYEDIIRRIFYNATNVIPRGDLLFSLALVSNRDFEREPIAVVPEDVQAEADRILETFALDTTSAGE